MQLNDFENFVSGTVLHRGRRYYKSGHVVGLMLRDDGEHWSALVEGSRGAYDVSVHLKGEEIVDWDCTCPYDWEPLCKHLVAVLLEIRDEIGSEGVPLAGQAQRKKMAPSRPIEEMLDQYEALSTAERQLLKVAALISEPFAKTRLFNLFIDNGYEYRGKRLYPKEGNQLLEGLAEKGFLIPVGTQWKMDKALSHQLCERYFSKEEDFPKVARSVAEAFPAYHWSYSSNHQGFFRQMRIARYTGQPGIFKDSYFTLVNRFYQHYNQDMLCDFWLPPSFDLEAVQRLPDRIRNFLLSEKLTLQTFDLSPAGGYYHYAQEKVGDMPTEDRLLVGRLLAQLSLLRGEWEAARRFARLSHDYIASAIEACLQFISGDTDAALDTFKKATKQVRMYTDNKKEVLQGFPGVMHVLAQLKIQDSKSLPKIRSLIVRLYKGQSSYRSVFGWLNAVVSFLQNDKQTAVAELKNRRQEQVFFLKFFLYFCQFWVDDRLVDPEQLKEDALQMNANGYLWLSTELLALLNELDQEQPVWEVIPDKQREDLGNDPLCRLLPRIEEWETALDVLLNLGREQTSTDSRLVWIVDFENERLKAKEQKLGKNGWTKGRRVAFNRLDSGELLCLTEQDRRIIRAIGYASGSEISLYGEGDNVWRAMVGHPLLFHWNSPTTAIQLVEVKPSLLVREQENGYEVRFSHPVERSGVQVIKETPTRYQLIDVSDRMAEIARALNGRKLFVPQEGAERLQQAVKGVSGLVSVQSAFDEEQLPSVEPDSRLHVHLLPVGDGFQVELYVKPFRLAPPYVKPGEGEATLIGLLDGQRTTTTRDLKAEEKEVKVLRSKVEILGKKRPHQGIWTLEDTEECLELLLQLDPLLRSEDIVLEWPRGEKLRVSNVVNTDQLRINIHGRGHWFEVSGELPVDEEKVLTMQELLALSERGEQFVEISPGQFVALTRAFRSRLQEVDGLMNAPKKGGPVQIHPLAAPALENFLSEVKQLEVDKKFEESRERLHRAFAKKFRTPKKFKADLRPYQQEGYKWLRRCAAWGVGACLADDMGLGKTIQALAVLTIRASKGPALVVAPASVCRNWRAETEKFAPKLNPVLFGDGDREATIETAGAGDLIIVTYDLMARESSYFAAKEFATVILDEAQAIKNRDTKRSKAAMKLQADFKIILTGTPVENHLGELWNLFQFLNPGLLGSFDRFRERFAIPIEKYKDEKRREQLRRLVQPFILRRRKDEVLKELPEKTEVTLTVELPPEERAFYEALRRNALERLMADDDGGGQQHLRILAELMRLRRAACHPNLVDENAGFTSSGKLRLFGEIVEELLDNDHRALVFSQFVGHLKILEDYLNEQGITYQYLDGRTSLDKRQQRIEAFQAGEGELFLISLKAGGTGLNLTAADYVIHTDPWWNPAVEDQATDRAHRIGQEKPVTVYRLVTEDTIEEKIIALHERKRDLADSLLAGTDVSAKLSAEELLELIKG